MKTLKVKRMPINQRTWEWYKKEIERLQKIDKLIAKKRKIIAENEEIIKQLENLKTK